MTQTTEWFPKRQPTETTGLIGVDVVGDLVTGHREPDWYADEQLFDRSCVPASPCVEEPLPEDSLQNQIEALWEALNSHLSDYDRPHRTQHIQLPDKGRYTHTEIDDKLDQIQNHPLIHVPDKYGVTRAALQQAIDENVALYLGDSTVTYLLDGTINVPSDRRLYANGAILKRGPGSAYDMISLEDGGTNMYLQGITIDGNRHEDSLANDPENRFSGIYCRNLTGWNVITQCTIVRTVGAEYIDPVTRLDGDGGIYIGFCNDLLVEGCTFYDHDRTAIFMHDSTNVTLAKNNANSNVGSGISGGQNESCKYLANTCNDNGVGGGTYTGLNASGNHLLIVDNHAHRNTGAGIILGHDTIPSSFSVAVGNACNDNVLEGLLTLGGRRHVFSSNTLKGNQRQNFRVTYGSRECLIVNNVSQGAPSGNGFLIDAVDSPSGGYPGGFGHVVSGNMAIENTAASGIYFNTGCKNCICEGNMVIDNNRGITVFESENIVVSDNRVYDSRSEGNKLQQHGIYVAAGTGNIISTNNIQGNVRSFEAASGALYSFEANQLGSDSRFGAFNFTDGGPPKVITNDNVFTAARVVWWPINTTATRGRWAVQSAVQETSFTFVQDSTDTYLPVGTEAFGYAIL